MRISSINGSSKLLVKVAASEVSEIGWRKIKLREKRNLQLDIGCLAV
jgi:hypothetical protein